MGVEHHALFFTFRRDPPPVMAGPQAMPSAQAISSTQDNTEDTYLNIPKTCKALVLPLLPPPPLLLPPPPPPTSPSSFPSSLLPSPPSPSSLLPLHPCNPASHHS